MATPAYQGTGQPLADSGSGWLGRLGSFFGSGGTPTYAGDGQPSTSGGGYLGGSSPAYAQAPTPKPSPSKDSSSGANDVPSSVSVTQVGTCELDTGAIASGQYAIVIPRERLGP